MKLKLDEADYLAYQLYTASKSPLVAKKKRNGWILSPLIFLLLATLFYSSKNYALVVYFFVSAVLTAILFPHYFKWRYKRHYKKHIKTHYQKRFGQEAELNFTSNGVFYKDETGEGKINLSEIKQANETATHFFVELKIGNSLLIPKRELTSIEEFQAELAALKIDIINENDWKW